MEQVVSAIMVNAAMPEQKKDAVRCRPIAVADLDAVAALLTRGFPDRARDYWDTALSRLRERVLPRDTRGQDCPRFGYVLTANERPVGVLLLIFSADTRSTDAAALRCNVSSWYVEPEFRSYASLLVTAAIRTRGVTYLNISPAAHTWPILEAQGYRRYGRGQLFAIPALSRPRRDVVVRVISPVDPAPVVGLDPSIAELLRRHAGYGCISLVCSGPEGVVPFMFVRRPTARNLLSAAQLTYCRDLQDFAGYAGNLGRFLLARGIAIAVVDTNAPLPGVVGKFAADKATKYARGAQLPVLGDFSDTELTLFGA